MRVSWFMCVCGCIGNCDGLIRASGPARSSVRLCPICLTKDRLALGGVLLSSCSLVWTHYEAPWTPSLPVTSRSLLKMAVMRMASPQGQNHRAEKNTIVFLCVTENTFWIKKQNKTKKHHPTLLAFRWWYEKLILLHRGHGSVGSILETVNSSCDVSKNKNGYTWTKEETQAYECHRGFILNNARISCINMRQSTFNHSHNCIMFYSPKLNCSWNINSVYSKMG